MKIEKLKIKEKLKLNRIKWLPKILTGIWLVAWILLIGLSLFDKLTRMLFLKILALIVMIIITIIVIEWKKYSKISTETGVSYYDRKDPFEVYYTSVYGKFINTIIKNTIYLYVFIYLIVSIIKDLI